MRVAKFDLTKFELCFLAILSFLDGIFHTGEAYFKKFYIYGGSGCLEIEAQELISLAFGLYFGVHSKSATVPRFSDKQIGRDVDAGQLSKSTVLRIFNI